MVRGGTCSLADCDVTDEGIRCLSKLSTLTSLDLDGCENVDDEGVDSLRHCAALSRVSLRHVGASAQAIGALLSASRPRLAVRLERELDLEDNHFFHTETPQTVTFADFIGSG